MPPSSIDTVVLTHAHIDHTGYLPLLVRDGFAGRVLATRATRDLATLLLPDSGRLLEEEAETANRLGYSKHHPARPLYTEADAHRCIPRIDGQPYGERIALGAGLALTFRGAGHILGSASVEVEVTGGRRVQRILFSGDLGRYGRPVIPDPVPVARATALLVECTYGDRLHGTVEPKEALAAAIREAAQRGGAIVIPAFAIGRAQDLLYYLRELEAEARIPVLDVFVDSPMAIDATPIFARHPEEHDAEMRALLAKGAHPFQTQRLHFTTTVEESKRINDTHRCIIISASGMLTGGRILHHLKHRLPDPRNTILFVGFQGEGTRGRALQEGAKAVKIHGQSVRVEAHIETVSGFSAHGDANEIMQWMDGFEQPPERIFCVHGERAALAAMKARVEARGPAWRASVPNYLDEVSLE